MLAHQTNFSTQQRGTKVYPSDSIPSPHYWVLSFWNPSVEVTRIYFGSVISSALHLLILWNYCTRGDRLEVRRSNYERFCVFLCQNIWVRNCTYVQFKLMFLVTRLGVHSFDLVTDSKLILIKFWFAQHLKNSNSNTKKWAWGPGKVNIRTPRETETS